MLAPIPALLQLTPLRTVTMLSTTVLGEGARARCALVPLTQLCKLSVGVGAGGKHVLAALRQLTCLDGPHA